MCQAIIISKTVLNLSLLSFITVKSKKLESIGYVKNKDNTYTIRAYPIDGDTPIVKRLEADKIEDFVGKEIAKNIIDGKGRKSTIKEF